MYFFFVIFQFNYEAPRTIFWQNLVALALFPVYMQGCNSIEFTI